jgi:hypothetical protein
MEGVLPALPWTVARAGLKVPYRATPTFQPAGTSFYDFPRENGFPSIDNANNLGGNTVDSLTSFLQSWLFFELLSAFLERPINQRDFVANGFIEIDQKSVHNHFIVWKAELSKSSYARRRQAQKDIEELIKIALWKSDIFEEAADRFESRGEDFDNVALSVKLLISLLHSISEDTFSAIGPRLSGPWAPWVSTLASRIVHWNIWPYHWFGLSREFLSDHLAAMGEEDARRHLHSQPNRFRPFPSGSSRGGCAAERLYRLFVSNGWCPYRALQLCQSYDYLVLNSLASLKRNPASVEDHGQCVKLQRCCAHNLIVDSHKEYPFQHDAEEACDCEFVQVPREEITEIIQSGGIPLISVSLENDLDLQVVQCTPYMTYTAISHVWSDGLGNPQSNALPRCQLLRLRKMISQTYYPEYSPFYDDSTVWSRARSARHWALWRATRSSKPYSKIEKKRVYFWMDTLCIPVPVKSQPAKENKALKFRAMKHITPIFAGAFSTLVLDKGLQAVSVPDPSQVSGDEFAAIVFSSKWMQRGWTLEEGSLSSACVFQTMGKLYEISGSLNRIPKAEVDHSPLERASINARRLMPLLLNRALLDEKKKLSNDPFSWRASRLTKLLRIPQFVWTWNSLLERSTTESNDGPIILANLLDFNIFSLKLVPSSEERLKLLIQNCDELPLSLLYNTGPRMSIRGHPELGWIPRSIAGDHLIVGAALRRTKSKGTDSQVKFFIDRSETNSESLLFLGTLPGQRIPYDDKVFAVQAQTSRDSNVKQEYIVEIQRPPIEGPDDETNRRIACQTYGQFQGMCVVIDLACGTRSRRGFAGKGVRFYVDSYKEKGMILKYDAPLTAWTPDQWQHRYKRIRAAIPPFDTFDTEHVGRAQRLLLKYGTIRTFSNPKTSSPVCIS